MISLTNEAINPQTAIDAVLTDADGAYVLFTGVVRNHSRGVAVTGLEYHAYPPMALRQMEQIAQIAQERWGLRCAVLHRVGYLAVGEIAVVVCVAGAHRGEAFEACRWIIDTVKAEVPIWKKEFAASGTFWIEGSDAVPTPDDTPVEQQGNAVV